MMLRVPLGRKDTILLINECCTKLKDDENFPFLAMLHSDRTGDQINELFWFSPKPKKAAPHEPSSASTAQNITSSPFETEVAIDLGKYEPTHFKSEHVTIRELLNRFGISHPNAKAARWAFGHFGSAIIVRAHAIDFLARERIHYSSKGSGTIIANPGHYSAAEYPTAGKSVWVLNAPTAPPARHHATESPVATPLAALIVISKQVLATFNSQSNPRQPKQQQQRKQPQSQQQHQQEQQPRNNNTTNETALTTENKRNDNDTGKQNTEIEGKHCNASATGICNASAIGIYRCPSAQA